MQVIVQRFGDFFKLRLERPEIFPELLGSLSENFKASLPKILRLRLRIQKSQLLEGQKKLALRRNQNGTDFLCHAFGKHLFLSPRKLLLASKRLLHLVQELFLQQRNFLLLFGEEFFIGLGKKSSQVS